MDGGDVKVMCRVHSLVLWILVAFEVASLMLALGEGAQDGDPWRGSIAR